MNGGKTILKIEAVKCQPLKQLFESLRELLDTCNLQFDEKGIRILALDGSHVCLVHSRLDANKFVKYECSRKFINAGISVGSFYKLLKPISASDTVTFTIEAENENELNICVKSQDKGQVSTYAYKLLDIDETDFNIPDVCMPVSFKMPSKDFQDICRHLGTLAEVIDIKCINDQLNIGCEGDFASVEQIYRPVEDGLHFISQSNEPIQGRFSLKFLLLFTKATPLSQDIQVSLKNDFPLIITYAIADIGELKFCLSPKVT